MALQSPVFIDFSLITTHWQDHATRQRPGQRGGEGVGLESRKNGGAHYPNPKILLKTSIRPYDNNLFLKKIFLKNVLLLEWWLLSRRMGIAHS